MEYKGNTAHFAFSEGDGGFVGHIEVIDDIVGFHGDTVEELRAAFEEAVDDYVETCKKLERSPEKPHSRVVRG